MRYVQMNTGKGEVEPRIRGFPMEEDFPGPIGNKVRAACLLPAYTIPVVIADQSHTPGRPAPPRGLN